MQIWLILRLGVLLGSCLSAAAQAPDVLIREPSTPLLMLVPVVPTLLPAAPVLPAPAARTASGGFTVVLNRVDRPDRAPKGLPAVEVTRTVFATESRVPILQLPGGRLQLDGFTGTYHMNNLLLGPLGLSHPVVGVPRLAWVYGISLRFRLGHDARMERQRVAASGADVRRGS